jgi:predicted  nucleic acid-binding Zn-ribbon protein
MKATPQHQETLLELNRIDLQLRRNQKQIDEINRGEQVQAQRQLLLANSERLLVARNELDALELELTRAETDLKLVEGRIAKDETRLQQSSNQKDVQGMQSELQSLAKRKGELEDAELVLLERKDEILANLKTIELERAEIQKTLEILESEQTSGLAKLNSGQQLLREDRARNLGLLTAEVSEHYEKLSSRDVGVGRLDGLICDACGMTLSGDSIDAVRNTPADELAHCGECGAILVRF